MLRLSAALRSSLFLALFLLASRQSPAQTPDADLKLERETFALINEYRSAEQLAPFTWNSVIAETARAHSREMASGDVGFGHAGFSGRVKHLMSELTGLRGCGENVLMTSDPHEAARSAVAYWLKSPPHLHNIRGDFALSGIGVAESAEGVIYFTEVFVKVAPAPLPDETPN